MREETAGVLVLYLVTLVSGSTGSFGIRSPRRSLSVKDCVSEDDRWRSTYYTTPFVVQEWLPFTDQVKNRRYYPRLDEKPPLMGSISKRKDRRLIC